MRFWTRSSCLESVVFRSPKLLKKKTRTAETEQMKTKTTAVAEAVGGSQKTRVKAKTLAANQ